MSSFARTINLLGFAPVIAVVAPDRKDRAADVSEYFTPQPASQLGSTSLASSARDPNRPTAVDATRVYPNLGVVYGTVDRDGLAALRAQPVVRKVAAAPQPSMIRPAGAARARLTANHTWGLTAMEIPALWAQGLTGAGVAVAHLDTGVDAAHPALRDAVAGFAQFDHSGRQVPDAAPADSDHREAHGTHTAATIAGRPVRRRHVGVAPGAALHCAMVIEGGDLVARILGGMDWAVGLGVRVLSMSLGIRGLVADFLDIVDILRANRVLPVIAVGNEGPGSSRSPGNYPKALSVGAHDASFEVPELSSSQRFLRRSQPLVPDVVAPGVDVISAGPGRTWLTNTGTSMAVPHVAGLAALLLEAAPNTSVAKLERAIFASAHRHGMDVERANRGAVHGPRALAALTR